MLEHRKGVLRDLIVAAARVTIQVGSAHGAKSLAVFSAQWPQRNGQADSIAHQRFEVDPVFDDRRLAIVRVFGDQVVELDRHLIGDRLE